MSAFEGTPPQCGHYVWKHHCLVRSEGRPAAGRGDDAARQQDGDAAGGDAPGGEEAAAEDGGRQEGGRAQEARIGNLLHTAGELIFGRCILLQRDPGGLAQGFVDLGSTILLGQ